jgi:hypothetical protein
LKKKLPHEVLRGLIEQEPAISQRKAAMLLAHVTRRPVSSRAIEAWLAAPGSTPHARPTPTWTIDIFQQWRDGKIDIDIDLLR